MGLGNARAEGGSGPVGHSGINREFSFDEEWDGPRGSPGGPAGLGSPPSVVSERTASPVVGPRKTGEGPRVGGPSGSAAPRRRGPKQTRVPRADVPRALRGEGVHRAPRQAGRWGPRAGPGSSGPRP